MSFGFLFQSIFELGLIITVFWCIFNEGKLISLEKRIACNIRRRRLKLVKASRPVERPANNNGFILY